MKFFFFVIFAFSCASCFALTEEQGAQILQKMDVALDYANVLIFGLACIWGSLLYICFMQKG